MKVIIFYNPTIVRYSFMVQFKDSTYEWYSTTNFITGNSNSFIPFMMFLNSNGWNEIGAFEKTE